MLHSYINTILHGDSLELMKDIPSGSIDMILCDLPYGTTKNEWDKKLELNLIMKILKYVLILKVMKMVRDTTYTNNKEINHYG